MECYVPPSPQALVQVVLSQLEVSLAVRVEDGREDVGVLCGVGLDHHAGHLSQSTGLLLVHLQQGHGLGREPEVRGGDQGPGGRGEAEVSPLAEDDLLTLLHGPGVSGDSEPLPGT